VEIRADLYCEEGSSAAFDVEAALQMARAAVARAHACALAHVLFTVRSTQEGGMCPPLHVLSLLKLGFRMGCEIVDVEASARADTRSALLQWLQRHFSTSPPSSRVSAVLSSVHVTNASVTLHDDHICARSLAAAAACVPAPHALKFAAVVTDDVASARMQQQALQAQTSFNLPVCCVAMVGEGAGSSGIAAVSRLRCPTLTFCRPASASAPTASG
jgi:3-dehydroquinate dehydratase